MRNGKGPGSNESPAERAKRKAIERVAKHADGGWKDFMYDVIYTTYLRKKRLNADDPWELYESLPDPKPVTHENRAMGALMLDAARLGWGEKAPVPAQNSRRAGRHASPLTMWDSKIYEGND